MTNVILQGNTHRKVVGLTCCLMLAQGVCASPLVWNVPEGVQNHTEPIGADVESITKTGAGTLHIQQGTRQNEFAGTVSVQGGVLSADSVPNFGKPSKIVVEEGATLDLSATAGTDVGYVKDAALTIAGRGANDAGAIRLTSSPHDDLLKNLSLSADSLICNSAQFGLSGGILDFNGNRLEKKGSSPLTMSYVTWKNPGSILLSEGQLTLLNESSDYAGDSSNYFIGMGGVLAFWDTWGVEKAPKWTLAVSNDFQLMTYSTKKDANAWSGPVTVAPGKKLVVNPKGSGCEITLAGNIDNQGTIEKWDVGGVLSVCGNVTTNKKITIGGGTVRFSGTGTHELGSAEANIYSGTLAFLDAGRVHHYAGNIWLSGSANQFCTLSVTNTVFDGYRSDGSFGTIQMGYSEGCNGRMIVDAGSVVSNKLMVGWYGRGAVHQRSGEVYWEIVDSQNTEPFGAYGYGFYGLDAGSVVASGWMGMGVWSSKACAIFAQKGGSFKLNNALKLGNYGYGEVYVGKGDYQMSGGLEMGVSTSYPDSGFATVTVADGGSLSLPRMGGLSTTGNAVVNLNNGGKLSCGRLMHGSSGELYLNANGGVLCPTWSWGFTGQLDASANDPTQTTVYDGGITIDASACAVDGNDGSRIPFAIKRATGMGIKSITLPASDSAFWTANFLGPTRVRISGAGKAATALVDFDLATSKPRGVIVTSAGFDYDANTTVTVDSWDGTTTYPCTVEMFEHQGKGGLTVTGTSTVTLAGANTYGGTTTVESGVLAFATASSYPAGSPLVMCPSGKVDFYGRAMTLPSVSGAGTVMNGNVTVTEKIAFRISDAIAGRSLEMTGKLTLANGARLEVLDPENLSLLSDGVRVNVVTAAGGIEGKLLIDPALSQKWHVSVRGGKIDFGAREGLMLIFR